MIVLGIDPGLNITGYGLLDWNGGPKLLEGGVIRTVGHRSMAERLYEIGKELEGIIKQFTPDVVALEELYSHYAHPKTAIIMGHARGIVILKAAEAGIPVHSYAATKIKKSLTGNGRATKSQVQRMIASSLALSVVPEPPDAADALAVALCHCRVLEMERKKKR